MVQYEVCMRLYWFKRLTCPQLLNVGTFQPSIKALELATYIYSTQKINYFPIQLDTFISSIKVIIGDWSHAQTADF